MESIKWTHLLRYRQLWAFALGKMLTDPIWWFFLFWLPKWLNETRDINMAGLGIPLIMIYPYSKRQATIGRCLPLALWPIWSPGV